MSALRVLLIGTSFGRHVQAPGFQRHSGFELAGIAGGDRARTERIAGELGVPAWSDDWRGLLAELRPDAVSICTPVHWHHPMMMAALAGGAHVLCEKPTALHRGQAAEMRDAAAAAGRVAAIHHEFRFFPARALALQRVRAGDIGRPRRGDILGRYAIWPRSDSRPFTWLADASRGGGILGALGSHHTDCLRQFFGEPERVCAQVRVEQPRRGVAIATADDACTLRYDFAGGATALVDLNAHANERWERFEIEGETATLRWDETGYRLWRVEPGAAPEELEIPQEYALAPREGDPPLLAPFMRLLGNFHRAITSGEPMAPDFGDAVAVQCVLDAARESSAAGAPVAVARA